jgi:hypothetical protein
MGVALSRLQKTARDVVRYEEAQIGQRCDAHNVPRNRVPFETDRQRDVGADPLVIGKGGIPDRNASSSRPAASGTEVLL